MKHFFYKMALSILALCIPYLFMETGFCVEYPNTLTTDEISWLKSISTTPIRYVIPPKFAPVSFVQNGKADGIIKEYLALIGDTLGLNFQLMDVTWKDGIELAKKGEVDLFPCLSNTPEREEFLTFVKGSYIAFPPVIVTRKDSKSIRRVEDLDNKRVAVDRTLAAYSKLKNDYSQLNIQFVFVQTNPNAIKAVHVSEADAAISSSAVAGYLIAKNGWNNLKIAGETGWPEAQMTMGVKKEWPLFVSILEKTLATIPESTRTAINNKWIPISFEHSFDSVYVMKRILPVLGFILSVTLVVCLFLVVVIRKNRQLREAEEKINDAYRELESAWKVAKEASRAKSEILDNSGQGFLSFGEDLTVDTEYSKECETIFAQSVGGKNISDLLFTDEEISLKKNFQRTVSLTLNEQLDLKQDLYLSLLKPFYKVNDRHIKAEYRLIGSRKMMLILTDITREKVLEQDVLIERNRLKFVIAAVRETKDFFTIIEDLRKFQRQSLPELFHEHKHDPREMMPEIYRAVHTFKGLFAQQEFITFPEWLHNMESRISDIILNETFSTETIEQFISDFQNEMVLEQDLKIIRDVLGESFMERKGGIIISNELANNIEWVAQKLLNTIDQALQRKDIEPENDTFTDKLQMSPNDDHHKTITYQALSYNFKNLSPEFMDLYSELLNPSSQFRKILLQASRIRHVNLKTLMHSHVEGVLRLASRLGKQITQFQVEGDDVWVDPDRFMPFIRTLVNVFRNAVDHGIETPEERVESNKEESGIIGCSISKEDKKIKKNAGDGEGSVLLAGVLISISDDGRGIDLEAIKVKAVEKNLMTPEQVNKASDRELIRLIFSSGFSTRKNANSMSGRGIGLNAVQMELEQLNGLVEIETEMGKGTKIIFNIPLQTQPDILRS